MALEAPQYFCYLHMMSYNKDEMHVKYVLIDGTRKPVVEQSYIVQLTLADTNGNFNDGLQDILSFEGFIICLEKDIKETFGTAASPLFITTDDRLMRQVIHPEAFSRGLELPGNYFMFHDLYKEVYIFCKATKNSELKKLLNEATTSSENMKIKVDRDLVMILQLIDKGCKFEHAEKVSWGYRKKVFHKDGSDLNDCVVMLKGLPFSVSDLEIADFFRGLNIVDGGIAVCVNPKGRRNGIGYVCFENRQQRALAVERHKKYLNTRYIEVYPVDSEEFYNVACSNIHQVYDFLKRGKSVVRVKGLPFSCTEEDIANFFQSGEHRNEVAFGKIGIHILRKHPRGKVTGEAIVVFSEQDGDARACSKHREKIGNRYIEVFKMNFSEALCVMSMQWKSNMLEGASDETRNFILIRGLPYNVTSKSICFFLGGHTANILEQGIHLLDDGYIRLNKVAVIEMASEHDALQAQMEKHLRSMPCNDSQERLIEVYQVSKKIALSFITNGFNLGIVPCPVQYPSPCNNAGLLGQHPLEQLSGSSGSPDRESIMSLSPGENVDSGLLQQLVTTQPLLLPMVPGSIPQHVLHLPPLSPLLPTQVFPPMLVPPSPVFPLLQSQMMIQQPGVSVASPEHSLFQEPDATFEQIVPYPAGYLSPISNYIRSKRSWEQAFSIGYPIHGMCTAFPIDSVYN